MIAVTGAAGFIGSCLAGALNLRGRADLVLADRFSREDKKPNYTGKKYAMLVDRAEFPAWLEKNAAKVDFVFHMGARTDTAEMNTMVFEELNLGYSKEIWEVCTRRHIPLTYASSAATYGDGSHGYSDRHGDIPLLNPLNPYGESKHAFDRWVLSQKETPPFWAGLKFFNVYGPNEYHKGRMASVVFHAFRQIKSTGRLQLFRSHNTVYRDGYQLRDFIFITDVTDVCLWMMEKKPGPGIYNTGTGKARTFLDLGHAVFRAMDLKPEIDFIDTPPDIRDRYQYFTEADMSKMRNAGYLNPFVSLEDGIYYYVNEYLAKERYY